MAAIGSGSIADRFRCKSSRDRLDRGHEYEADASLGGRLKAGLGDADIPDLFILLVYVRLSDVFYSLATVLDDRLQQLGDVTFWGSALLVSGAPKDASYLHSQRTCVLNLGEVQLLRRSSATLRQLTPVSKDLPIHVSNLFQQTENRTKQMNKGYLKLSKPE